MNTKDTSDFIYKTLLKYSGHQNWWPGETADEIIIGAILTQRVNWQNVEQAILNLKINNLCTIWQIHNSKMEDIAVHIKPSLYYNQKAKKLKNFAEFVFAGYNGDLNSMFQTKTNILRNQLLSINGIGEETADSILLYAGHKCVFVIDAYTKRILSRIGLTKPEWSYIRYQRFITNNINHDIDLFQDYHAQLVNLGKNICRRKPLCNSCDLTKVCKYYGTNYE